MSDGSNVVNPESNGQRKKEKPRFRRNYDRIEVEIEEKDGSLTDAYLQELSGEEKDKYVNLSLQRGRYSESGARIGYDVKDLEAILVEKCLFRYDGSKYKFDEVRDFPSSQLNGLYRLCEEMNALNPQARTAVKNG